MFRRFTARSPRACAGVTLNSVATAIGFILREGIVKAEGDLDFKETLGVSKEAPVGFKAIRLTFTSNLRRIMKK